MLRARVDANGTRSARSEKTTLPCRSGLGLPRATAPGRAAAGHGGPEDAATPRRLGSSQTRAVTQTLSLMGRDRRSATSRVFLEAAEALSVRAFAPLRGHLAPAVQAGSDLVVVGTVCSYEHALGSHDVTRGQRTPTGSRLALTMLRSTPDVGALPWRWRPIFGALYGPRGSFFVMVVTRFFICGAR